MLRILRFIIFGVWNIHQHEWETVERAEKPDKFALDRKQIIILKCKTCGLYKRLKFDY